jgi:hypothetical protein
VIEERFIVGIPLWLGREFFGSQRLDRKRVNRERNEVGDFAQDPLVALQSRHVAKQIRHDHHGKVPATPGGARMADVCGAVVANLQHGRRKWRKSRAQERSDISSTHAVSSVA